MISISVGPNFRYLVHESSFLTISNLTLTISIFKLDPLLKVEFESSRKRKRAKMKKTKKRRARKRKRAKKTTRKRAKKTTRKRAKMKSLLQGLVGFGSQKTTRKRAKKTSIY